jgi:hypothetical protein
MDFKQITQARATYEDSHNRHSMLPGKLPMSRFITLIAVVAVGLLPGGCSEHDTRSATSVQRVKPVEGVEFSMAVLSSGVMFAYNPDFNDHLLATRYSERVSTEIRPLMTNTDSSCSFVGLEAFVRGNLVKVGREKKLMLDIENISELRPLPASKRQQFQARSPTLSPEKIC